MSQPRICVVGASNLDLVSFVPRLPRLGETLHGSRFQLVYGGKGANQAVTAARLGGRVTLVAKLGHDPFGNDMLANLRREGIDATHVSQTSQAFTGVAPIAVDEQGNNAIIIVAGANQLLSVDDVEAAREAIAQSHVLICQLETPLETSLAALRIARDAGVKTIFNPAPGRADLPDACYALADVFCPNETETELITGLPVATPEEAERAAAALLQRGPGCVALTLGERGSLLRDASGAEWIAAEAVQPVDTTGAGDAFVGSLAYFWASGHGLGESMRRAARVAAISVQRAGTQTSFPTAAELPGELFG